MRDREPQELEYGQELLQKINSSEVVIEAFRSSGWVIDEVTFQGDVVSFERNEKIGVVLGVDRSGMMPEFFASMDIEGEFIWLWHEKNYPDLVAVVGRRAPEYVNLSKDNWEANLAEAIKKAAAVPGTYIDYELAGRQNSFTPPVF